MTKEEVLARSMPGVCAVAKSYAGKDNELLEDLVQEGRIAAYAAIDSFNPNRGSLNNWLVAKARAAMRHFLRDKGRTIRTPAYQQERGTGFVHTVPLDSTLDDMRLSISTEEVVLRKLSIEAIVDRAGLTDGERDAIGAELSGCPPKTSKHRSLLATAQAKMRAARDEEASDG